MNGVLSSSCNRFSAEPITSKSIKESRSAHPFASRTHAVSQWTAMQIVSFTFSRTKTISFTCWMVIALERSALGE